jgi:hypothetical protein
MGRSPSSILQHKFQKSYQQNRELHGKLEESTERHKDLERSLEYYTKRNRNLELLLKQATKRHQDLERSLTECAKERQCLKRTIDSQSGEMRRLENQVDEYIEDAKATKRSQLLADEKIRRQAELLEELRAALDALVQQNNDHLVKQATLQRWTDCLDDEEARQTMTQLFQDLETWALRHFPRLLTRYSPNDLDTDNISVNSSGTLETFYQISSHISYGVFDFYLNQTMVGNYDLHVNRWIDVLDKQIRNMC